MITKKNNFKFIYRLIFWLIYLFGGYILFSNKDLLAHSIINFARVLYPLSIFWLQLRLNNKERWFEINPSMSTSQLWYKILPVIGSLITIIITILNLLIFLISK